MTASQAITTPDIFPWLATKPPPTKAMQAAAAAAAALLAKQQKQLGTASEAVEPPSPPKRGGQDDEEGEIAISGSTQRYLMMQKLAEKAGNKVCASIITHCSIHILCVPLLLFLSTSIVSHSLLVHQNLNLC